MVIRSQRRAERGRTTPPAKTETRPAAATQLAVVRTVLATEAVHADSPGSRAGPMIPASLREDLIRDAAYFRAQARGFAPGSELSDWLAAEEDIDELIVRQYGR